MENHYYRMAGISEHHPYYGMAGLCAFQDNIYCFEFLQEKSVKTKVTDLPVMKAYQRPQMNKTFHNRTTHK